jgi:hypothetical protein
MKDLVFDPIIDTYNTIDTSFNGGENVATTIPKTEKCWKEWKNESMGDSLGSV